MQPETLSGGQGSSSPHDSFLAPGALTTLSDLVALGRSSSVRALEVDADGVRLRVEFTADDRAPDAGRVPAPTVRVSDEQGPSSDDPAPTRDHDTAPTRTVCAPLVGVLYRRPQPGAATFCEVGDHVEQGQQVAIIEAMKMMNEVLAPCSGTVVELVATENDVVQFGQALIVVGEA